MPWCVLNENILYTLSLQAKGTCKMYNNVLNDSVHVGFPLDQSS